jgi:hypothetical protein
MGRTYIVFPRPVIPIGAFRIPRHVGKSQGFSRGVDSEKQKSQAPGGVAFDAQQALELLKDIPRLIERATPQERLALVKSLFDQIWVENRRIAKLAPRTNVVPVLAALVRVLDGVPDGFRTRSLLIHSQALCH